MLSYCIKFTILLYTFVTSPVKIHPKRCPNKPRATYRKWIKGGGGQKKKKKILRFDLGVKKRDISVMYTDCCSGNLCKLMLTCCTAKMMISREGQRRLQRGKCPPFAPTPLLLINEFLISWWSLPHQTQMTTTILPHKASSQSPRDEPPPLPFTPWPRDLLWLVIQMQFFLWHEIPFQPLPQAAAFLAV